MNLHRHTLLLSLLFLVVAIDLRSVCAQSITNEIRIIELRGSAEISTTGGTDWILTQTNAILRPSYLLRTGANSRVALRWSDDSILRFGASTEIEILPPDGPAALSGLQLLQGIISFFHRDKPGRIRVITRGAFAGIEGTEFVMEVQAMVGVERTTLSVIDGIVQFSNHLGVLRVTNSPARNILGGRAMAEQAVVELGQAPRRAPSVIANNVLQWCLYYPAVLDLHDLPLTSQEQQALSASLVAYRSGDLVAALANYPAGRQSISDAERVYYASLLLSVGQVEQTEAVLTKLPPAAPERLQRLAAALHQLIAAVKHERNSSTLNPQLSTEFLAASYYAQSLATGDESLKASLLFARQAATNSPQFGFAWARIAELEFSFGHTAAAFEAVNRGLELSPRNAQALALKGFLLAAQNKTREAIGWFNQAIAVDSALGNAWLGRGLCKIRLGSFPRPNGSSLSHRMGEGRGEGTSGFEDLLIAAALEPQRALLRSYLGKAYGDAGDSERAVRELKLARELDPKDPTGWLYSALLKQQENRINEAIADLETSQELNDNRSLFRSRLLLDEDRAVRSANLASIYRDAGMNDVALREAARAVTYDYANDSAHLFLSDSYNELRDPTRFNLRYETVWFNELLLANLLSPVGGGRLSQHISQQEYSRLFEADGLHLANSTLARTDKMLTELASQFGTFGRTSYSLDLEYHHNDGVRPNNDLDSIEWYTTIKEQITAQDTALVLLKYEDYHSGDNFQYYNPGSSYRPHFRFDEYQHPIAIGGWHHEWSPGVHTLLLGGRLENEQLFEDKAVPVLRLETFSNGMLSGAFTTPFDVNYHNKLEIYTAELNQIFQWNRLTVSAGGRYQSGTIDAHATLDNPGSTPFLYVGTPTSSATSEGFERLTGYGYVTAEPIDRVWLTGGVAYDDITYPGNFRNPPLSSAQDHRNQVGPKAALVWEPIPEVTLRGMYAQSLGGVSLDESYRLEPTQLAGFPQTFRTLISESVVGSVAAPAYDLYGAALDLKFASRTYVGIQVVHLESDVHRQIGVFLLEGDTPPAVLSSTPQQLRYCEDALSLSANQLLGDAFSVGAGYKYDRAELQTSFPKASALNARDHAELHQLNGYVLYNHPSGFFARADATWYHQREEGIGATLSGDDFVQENFYVGYRFLHRHAEILLGILNLSDQDYHLNPLTVYAELPRERTFMVRLNFQF